MPIYAYRCASCGFENDHLQKLSDPRLQVCPQCGEDSYCKQVTAAGFQLKGDGWYATDFKNGNSKAPATNAATDKGEAPAAPEKPVASSEKAPAAAASSGTGACADR